MNSLHETQRRFTDYVLRDLGQELTTDNIKGNGLSANQRLAIYRNNTQLGLTEALRDGYPVINKLVGTEFFNYLARNYIPRHSPKAGCLLSFGCQFADFIAEFELASGLPYLPDTARLEWFWHEAFHEEAATALDSAMLATVPPDAYDKLGFALHPSVRFLTSDYPVQKIWQAHQEDYEGNDRINLDGGGCYLLIYRPELEVEIISLHDTEFRFLSLLDMKLTLNQAVEQVLMEEPHFDIQPILQHGMKKGLLTDIYFKH